MIDIIASVSKETHKIDLNKSVIGNDGDNLQARIVYKFIDEFVEGQARLEFQIKGTKYWATLARENDTYTIPIKNVMTKEGRIDIQLVITEPSEDYELTKDTEIIIGKTYYTREGEEGSYYYVRVLEPVIEDLPTYYELINIPVFHSNISALHCNKSINAVDEAPEGYIAWIDEANAKLNQIDEALRQVDNLDVDAERTEDGVEITITKKDGSTKSVEVYDGEDGDASDYEKLDNQPQINGVTLIGDKSLEDLGINQDFVKDDNYVHTDNNFTNAYKGQITTNKSNVETLSGAVQEHDQDIQNIQNDIDVIEQDIDSLGTEIDNLDLNKQNKLTAGSNITIENDVISATGGSGGTVINIGSYQYTYEGYVLPAIDVAKARTIYANDKLGTPQVLLWTIYGNESQFKVVSSDEIAGTYSFDILVHNKYHCAYEWDDTTTGIINPTVQAGGEGGNVDDVQLNGVSILQNKIANIIASTNISDTPSDSKLVTEKTIYDYIASGNDGKTRTLDAVDLNTVTNTGFYSCNVCTNRPTENNGVMLVLKNGFSSDNLVQVYWTFVADVMWVRHKDLGNWKLWKKVSNLSASDIYATNLQTVQQNLERIDERIDGLPTDVQVNGTSIVEEGIANIDLTDYATKTYVDNAIGNAIEGDY